MAVSYAYAVGSVRAREKSLLTRADMEQLLAAESEDQLLMQLRDRGIGEGSTAEAVPTVDALLRRDTENLWAYLREIVPDLSVFNAFLYRNDIHNAKTVLKSILGNRDGRDLLMHPYTVAPDVLIAAVESRAFDTLPAWLSPALAHAYEVLAHTGDPQLSDALIDRAGLAAMQESAASASIPVLTAVIDATVFYADVKTALRAARAEKDAAFFEAALYGKIIDRAAWIRAALQGENELLSLLEKEPRWHCRQAVEAYRLHPAAFERWVDDYLMDETRRAKYVTLGAAPVIGYFLARESQNKVLHIVASGIRTGQDRESIRERMRMLYG